MNSKTYSKEIDRIRKAEQRELMAFNNIMTSLGDHIRITGAVGSSGTHVFFLYQHIKGLTVTKEYQGINEHKNIRIKVCNYFTQVSIGRYRSASHDNYFFGHISLKKAYPHTLIRPESIEDKIYEIIDPIEVDFRKSMLFDWKYFVLTKNEELLKNVIPTELLKFLARYDEVHMELKGKTCVFRRNLKAISSPEAVRFANFAIDLEKHLNS